MADSSNVPAPLIDTDGGDGDLLPAAEEEETKTEDHGNAPQNDIKEDLHRCGESVGASSGTSDGDEVVSGRARQTPEESQSEDHWCSERLREIVNVLDADQISINRICQNPQKRKSEDMRGESADDLGSSSGTRDEDVLRQLVGQLQQEDLRELLREVERRVEVDKLHTRYKLSYLEVTRVSMLRYLKTIKKFKAIQNGQPVEQNPIDVPAPLIDTDGGDGDLLPAAEEEETKAEDHGNAPQNDIKEDLRKIIEKFHAQVHDRRYLTKLKEIRGIRLQILMELHELKGSPGAPIA